MALKNLVTSAQHTPTELSKVPILHAEDSALNYALLLLFFFQNFHKNRYFCSKSRNFKRLNYICWQKAKFFGCFCVVQNCAELGFFFFFLFCRNGNLLNPESWTHRLQVAAGTWRCILVILGGKCWAPEKKSAFAFTFPRFHLLPLQLPGILLSGKIKIGWEMKRMSVSRGRIILPLRSNYLPVETEKGVNSTLRKSETR